MQMDDVLLLKFIQLLHKRFEARWPDCFVKNRALDKEIHDSANGTMYSHYLNFCNRISDVPSTPKYNRNKFGSQEAMLAEMYEDFEKAEDWIGWLMEFIPATKY